MTAVKRRVPVNNLGNRPMKMQEEGHDISGVYFNSTNRLLPYNFKIL